MQIKFNNLNDDSNRPVIQLQEISEAGVYQVVDPGNTSLKSGETLLALVDRNDSYFILNSTTTNNARLTQALDFNAPCSVRKELLNTVSVEFQF